VPHHGFSQLLEIGSAKPGGYFFTLNVDGQFRRGGFAAERMVECHGSIHHLQCTASCADEIWDTEIARRWLAVQLLMFGDWSWLGHRTEAHQQRFAGWLNGLVKS
jgi:hypothetical protein